MLTSCTWFLLRKNPRLVSNHFHQDFILVNDEDLTFITFKKNSSHP